MNSISVIVPIYNSEAYLNKCIDSLINQTKKDIEIILVNDGSTDASDKIIKSYKDKRIKYYKNKNNGIGYSRNFGIDKSNSKYIMFLDSDDYLDIHACEELYKKIEKDISDVVVSDFIKSHNGTDEIIKINDFKKTNLNKNSNILLDINLSPWNKIYSSKLIKDNNIRFPEDIKYEDVLFVLECLDKANNISKLNKALNYYIVRDNSETKTYDKKVFDILEVVKRFRSYFNNRYKEDIDKLTVKILTNYTIQQRYQVSIKDGYKFIDKVFNLFEKEIPDYKNNKYYEDRPFLKRTIEKSKLLTKIYIKLYKLK